MPTARRDNGVHFMIIWFLLIAVSVGLLAITADGRSANIEMAYYNMAVAAVTSIAFVVLALRSNAQLRGSNASRSALAANTAWSMSYVWIWGVVGIAVIYGTGILVWKEWWHFLLAFVVVACLCLYSAMTMQRRVDAGEEDDEVLLSRGRTATIVQLVGMIAVVVGLLVDGKMVRFMVERYTDWAANNIFFFGSAAIGIISAYAIMTQSKTKH